MANRQFNLIGQKFGKLTVLEETDPYTCVSSGTKERRYLCSCDCGNIKKIKQKSLRKGVKSCGCLRGRSKNEMFCNTLHK